MIIVEEHKALGLRRSENVRTALIAASRRLRSPITAALFVHHCCLSGLSQASHDAVLCYHFVIPRRRFVPVNLCFVEKGDNK